MAFEPNEPYLLALTGKEMAMLFAATALAYRATKDDMSYSPVKYFNEMVYMKLIGGKREDVVPEDIILALAHKIRQTQPATKAYKE